MAGTMRQAADRERHKALAAAAEGAEKAALAEVDRVASDGEALIDRLHAVERRLSQAAQVLAEADDGSRADAHREFAALLEESRTVIALKRENAAAMRAALTVWQQMGKARAQAEEPQ